MKASKKICRIVKNPRAGICTLHLFPEMKRGTRLEHDTRDQAIRKARRLGYTHYFLDDTDHLIQI